MVAKSSKLQSIRDSKPGFNQCTGHLQTHLLDSAPSLWFFRLSSISTPMASVMGFVVKFPSAAFSCGICHGSAMFYPLFYPSSPIPHAFCCGLDWNDLIHPVDDAKVASQSSSRTIRKNC